MVKLDFQKESVEALAQIHGNVLTYHTQREYRNACREVYRAGSANQPISDFVRLSNDDDSIIRRFLRLLKETGVPILRDVDASPNNRRIDDA